MRIEIINASKKIGRACILNDVSMELRGGMVYGFQGPNGSGKTMLMRLISGLIRPTSGEVWINGKKLGVDMDFPKEIGLLLENPAFIEGYTGFKNLALIAQLRNTANRDDICNALRDVGLDPLDKRKYRKYSLGMKQRLGIAAAIMEHPELIILDEPTNALDDDGVERIYNLIRREKDRGALVVISCHDTLTLQAVSDEIYTFHDGIVKKKVKE